jgi:uncharacterized protein DUF6228
MSTDSHVVERDELVLRSRDGAMLKFRVTERWTASPSDPTVESVCFEVELNAGGFVGSMRGSTHYVGSPSALFDSIAESWKGWTGTKEWHDEGKQVVLKATSDTTGHTKLAVELSHVREEFLLRATLVFDAGQLDDMARRVRKLFG